VDEDTRKFIRYSTYIIAAGLLILVIITGYNNTVNSVCDFRDDRDFLFGVGMRQEEHNFGMVYLFPKGNYDEAFTYNDKEIILCVFKGVGYHGKVRTEIEIDIFIRKDNGRKSERIQDLYGEQNG